MATSLTPPDAYRTLVAHQIVRHGVEQDETQASLGVHAQRHVYNFFNVLLIHRPGHDGTKIETKEPATRTMHVPLSQGLRHNQMRSLPALHDYTVREPSRFNRQRLVLQSLVRERGHNDIRPSVVLGTGPIGGIHHDDRSKWIKDVRINVAADISHSVR